MKKSLTFQLQLMGIIKASNLRHLVHIRTGENDIKEKSRELEEEKRKRDQKIVITTSGKKKFNRPLFHPRLRVQPH